MALTLLDMARRCGNRVENFGWILKEMDYRSDEKPDIPMYQSWAGLEQWGQRYPEME